MHVIDLGRQIFSTATSAYGRGARAVAAAEALLLRLRTWCKDGRRKSDTVGLTACIAVRAKSIWLDWMTATHRQQLQPVKISSQKPAPWLHRCNQWTFGSEDQTLGVSERGRYRRLDVVRPITDMTGASRIGRDVPL